MAIVLEGRQSPRSPRLEVKSVLVPLPDRDFDTTEVSVPWRLLTRAGHCVVFATEKGGEAPCTDPLLLDGGVFAKLEAEPEAKRFHRELESAPEFRSPIAWSEIDAASFDGLLLPGGHAPGMRQYLESQTLRKKVAEIWRLGRPVGAICHGVLVLARTRDPETGKSLLHDRKTTCLPKYMERAAYALTFWKLGRRYRTYPAYEEDEVRAALADPAGQFVRGPVHLTAKGTDADDRDAFVVEDGSYVSARWPGDAYLFAKKLAALLTSISRPAAALPRTGN
jgi:putative intracellular protease/amidase